MVRVQILFEFLDHVVLPLRIFDYFMKLNKIITELNVEYAIYYEKHKKRNANVILLDYKKVSTGFLYNRIYYYGIQTCNMILYNN